MSDLNQLAKTNPVALESIERLGETAVLWVNDVGDKLEKLPELSKQLKVPAVEQAVANSPVEPNDKTVKSGYCRRAAK